jgi:uncharacterized protein YjbI with pentapeptide repeats
MRKRLKLVRPSHATVVAYLALFVALGGGALAATNLAKNSVGAKQLRKNAVTGPKIKNGAVSGAKVADGSLTGADVQNQSLASADVLNGSLTGTDVLNESLAGTDVQNESLASPDVRNESLTGGDVQNASLTGTDVLNESLSGEDVLDESLTGTDVQNASLTGADVLNGSLTGGDVQAGSLTGGNLATGTVEPSNLATIPSVRARRTATQSIPNGSFTAIQLTSETWDHLAMHSTVSNNTRLTAPIDGIYLMTANAFWASNSTGERVIGFRLNGTNFVGFTADSADDVPETPLAISPVYLLNAGDFVEAMVQQTSGGALNLGVSTGGPETSPEVSMTWLGPA